MHGESSLLGKLQKSATPQIQALQARQRRQHLHALVGQVAPTQVQALQARQRRQRLQA
eukprot:CAMPEP_0175145042 /NCGR_PEP_ID=MMETSP0087-20121206/14517_1 /TAXON_ID=136419 /ORGANISM="Unknown Unknown, Strain D1" /LENGTH=57 /DNA_ID=CAMNT_0016429677 /DNA_START=1077 /DNA_END=1247 /DNA_ORIENTATION=-